MPTYPPTSSLPAMAPADIGSGLRRLSQVVEDTGQDALHILPLRTVPLKTPGLSRARMIKNIRLDAVIELFRDDKAGSGQIVIEDLPDLFDTFQDELEDDVPRLQALSRLNSFDVYTLRVELRRLNIPVHDHDMLKLSATKRQELSEYMRHFTLPLITHVYGGSQSGITDVNDLMRLFQQPNKAEALKNLRKLSDSLGVALHEIPAFLEDYGDIFLSLAYFRSCLDALVPEVQAFGEWVDEVKSTQQITRDPLSQKTLVRTNAVLSDISASITGRFEFFDRKSKHFWKHINGETFKEVKTLISSHHVTLAGVLCGLAVKMGQWRERFSTGGGSPQKRLDFTKSEILPGLAKIQQLEQSAQIPV